MSDSTEVQAGEVLPPDGKGRAPAGKDAEHASEVARIIAHWMDEFIRIPGTKIQMGLDPIIGLIPGIGGLLSSSVSLVVMIEAVRHRVSPAVFLRMGLNIAINEVLDAIPVVGDAASVFFKSNSLNMELLNRWKAGQKEQVKRGSRFLLIALLGGFFIILALWFTLWFTVLAFIYKGVKALFS